MSTTYKPIEILISTDFICPWCWIGHRRLAAGITLARLKVAPRIRYVPYEINPAMPVAGISRRQYRSTKFGSWARSLVMDEEASLAGRGVGLEFNFDRIEMTPNTRLAHRLMFMAQGLEDAKKTETLIEGIFLAYFTEGRDVGSLDVLADIATSAGFDSPATRAYLSGPAGEREVAAIEAQTATEGIRSLPTLRIAGAQISGAQPATVFAEALRSAEMDLQTLPAHTI